MHCDWGLRKNLYNNIILSGSNTLFEGMVERMTRRITSWAPSSMKIRVIAKPERKYFAWIGGSIKSSLSTFQTQWITKDEY